MSDKPEVKHPHSAIVPIGSLHTNSDNAKDHGPKQVRLIATSMERYGFLSPIIIDDNHMVVAGHGRYRAAKLLGLREIPVVRAQVPHA